MKKTKRCLVHPLGVRDNLEKTLSFRTSGSWFFTVPIKPSLELNWSPVKMITENFASSNFTRQKIVKGLLGGIRIEVWSVRCPILDHSSRHNCSFLPKLEADYSRFLQDPEKVLKNLIRLKLNDSFFEEFGPNGF